MSIKETFCLKWEDFGKHVSISFRELRKDLDFADVTLACEDKQFELHKLVISSGSKLFRNLLKKCKTSKPLIYLRGLQAKDLEAMVNFMYNGEVDIFEDDLNDFLILALEMQLNGLETGHCTLYKFVLGGQFKKSELFSE